MQRNIAELRNYEKNPRSISKDSFERLKEHIKTYGQQQPLVITPDGEVLGGNMRLRAYKELGIDDIWVHEYTPKDEADKLAISLMLNDRAGFYDSDLLSSLIPEFPDMNWKDFAVDLREGQLLSSLADLDSLIDRTNAKEEWVGLPEFEADDGSYKLTIHFETEEARGNYTQQQNIKIQTKTTKTWSTWYPYKEKEDKSSLKYE